MSGKILQKATKFLQKIPTKKETRKLVSDKHGSHENQGGQSIQSLIKEYRKSLSKPFSNSYWTEDGTRDSVVELPKDEKLIARQLLKFQSMTSSYVVGGSVDADDLITKLARLNVEPKKVPTTFRHLSFDDRADPKSKRKIEFKRLRYKMGIKNGHENFQLDPFEEDVE